jgi:hypothetical protein
MQIGMNGTGTSTSALASGGERTPGVSGKYRIIQWNIVD